jgi:hypothetical protein
MEEIVNLYLILEGMTEDQIVNGRPRHRWENNIKMNLKEPGYMVQASNGNEYLGFIKSRDFHQQLDKISQNRLRCN